MCLGFSQRYKQRFSVHKVIAVYHSQASKNSPQRYKKNTTMQYRVPPKGAFYLYIYIYFYIKIYENAKTLTFAHSLFCSRGAYAALPYCKKILFATAKYSSFGVWPYAQPENVTRTHAKPSARARDANWLHLK